LVSLSLLSELQKSLEPEYRLTAEGKFITLDPTRKWWWCERR